MELRHLKYFVAVAEELHFGRASERVGIAQPPFSQQIKKLEEEIGVPLLWRSKRHVELTAAGKVFLVEARKILAEAGKAGHMARRAARGEIGQLSVGFVSSAFYGEFTPVFRIMRARHPDVALALQDMTSEEQVRAMKENKLDVGLVRPPVPGAEGLAFEVVLREPFVVVLPKSHSLARQKSLAVNDLAQESFLMVPRSLGPGFYDQIIQLCAQSGFAPKVALEIGGSANHCQPDCRWDGRLAGSLLSPTPSADGRCLSSAQTSRAQNRIGRHVAGRGFLAGFVLVSWNHPRGRQEIQGIARLFEFIALAKV